MRYLFLIAGIVLMLLAGLKVYVAFKRPNIAPELAADATMLSLGGVVCFFAFKKIGVRK